MVKSPLWKMNPSQSSLLSVICLFSFRSAETRVWEENSELAWKFRLSLTMGSNGLCWHVILGSFPRRPLLSLLQWVSSNQDFQSPTLFCLQLLQCNNINSKEKLYQAPLSQICSTNTCKQHPINVSLWGSHPHYPLKAIPRQWGYWPEKWGPIWAMFDVWEEVHCFPKNKRLSLHGSWLHSFSKMFPFSAVWSFQKEWVPPWF